MKAYILPVARWFDPLLKSVDYGCLSWGLLLLILDPIINLSLYSPALYYDRLPGCINVLMSDPRQEGCPSFL